MDETVNRDAFKTESSQADGDNNFLVVGIGASAGGIQALRTFFANVSADSGMAYVVILHLSPDQDSQLAEVIQSAAAIPVSKVERRVRVKPNHVYVIPPNTSLEIMDGHIDPLNVVSTQVRRAPVDIFFRTLAQSHGPRAVSVVLSGTGANGSMGMKLVKEMGGLCIVQDLREAEYTDMPRHSLETGLVDYVLPAAAMPAQIVAYRELLKRIPVAEQVEPSEADANALRDILTQLRVSTGHDFSNYKTATIRRRIARRMGVHEISDLPAYSQLMHERPEEANALFKDLLISVTNFFRDAEAFKALETEILPKLFEGKGANDQVRAWVVGCATGEEAYTVAMMLSEYAANLHGSPQIQVFATDIDESAIARAREGRYTLNDAADVSPELLNRYFVNEKPGHYRVKGEIRERVLFAVHNVLKDPPFAHLDLATCRNFLIYLNRTAQRRVMDILHFALNQGRYLMLGSSESIEGAFDLYAVVDKEHHIYRGRPVGSRLVFPVPDGSLAARLAKLPRLPRITGSQPVIHPTLAQLHQRLLEQYAAPSVVVNEDYDILHMSDSAGAFMQVQGGEPSTNLLTLVRPELRLELRASLYQAAHHKVAVTSSSVELTVGTETKALQVRVRPVLSQEDASRGFFLVLFEDARPPEAAKTTELLRVTEMDEPLARRLEAELLELRAQLSATLEHHELQREELKASNEELQAMNEEMRAAAEELETSKEELQSINEELTTVNQELKIKIDELAHSHDDFRNLMNSAQIGTVFLDRELRIKLFTSAAREVLNLIPADVGRSVSDITTKLVDDCLVEEAGKVLQTSTPTERAVRDKDGNLFLMQVSPYRTTNDRISGVVVAFVNMTDRARAEQLLRESEEQFRRSIEDAPIPIILHAEDGEVLQVSKTWTELTGYLREDLPTIETWLTRAYGEGAAAVRQHMDELFKGKDRSLNVDFPFRTRDGSVRYWSFSASSPGRLRDGRRFIVGMGIDITEARRTEESSRESDARLRSMMDSVEDYAILMLDTEGCIESWNIGAERMFGYREQEVLGRDAALIFTPEDRERGVPSLEMETARSKGRAADERWHVRKDGERFYVSGVLSSLSDGAGKVTGYVKIARDLTEQRQAEEELRRAHDDLEATVRERTFDLAKVNESLRAEISERIQTEKERVRLLRQIVRAQEDERRRIARDIHDQLGQQMTALRLNLEAIDQACPDDGLRGKIAQTKTLAERLDADVDFLAWELRPAALDDIGLVSAVGNYLSQWSKHSGVETEFHSAGLDKERLSLETETNLYRITQEALNNTMKYAQAKRVDVLLERRDHQVVLIIEDDGVGFDVKKASGDLDKGMGLIGMRERAVLVGGRLEIESKPDEGTTIFARVPVKFIAEESGDGK